MLRTFNHEGIQHFRELMNNPDRDLSQNGDLDFVRNDSLTNILSPEIIIDSKPLINKLDAARRLLPVLSEVKLADKYYNTGLWSWLSACYFNSVCPLDEKGKRLPGNAYRYIPPVNRDWRTIYRHLLAGPIRLYGMHETNIKILFQSPLYIIGDFMEQLASRQEIASSIGILKAADLLYWDPETAQPKPGARATDRAPGTLRRFVDIMQQLMLTYDLYSLDEDSIIRLLPHKEFEIWLPEN